MAAIGTSDKTGAVHLDVITPFILGLAKAVPGLVGNWIQTRNTIRVEYTRARLTETADQARHRRALELQEFAALSQSYPLGTPGRLRSILNSSGLPTILVSPLPPTAWLSQSTVPIRVLELLGEIESIGAYAQPLSGAFVQDIASRRFVDGEVGARTIARLEFGHEPAILVYFEQGVTTLTARAFLSTVFGSVGGDTGFSFAIARYGKSGASESTATALGGDLPAWRIINLESFPDVDHAEVVAYTVTWFLLAVIDAYWTIRSGTPPGLLRSVGIGSVSTGPACHETTTEPRHLLASDPIRHARVEQEAQRLAASGFEVTAEEVTDRHIGLHVKGLQKDVIFVLDDEYPQSPPARIQTAETSFQIEASDWSPECTLIDVVEALP